MLWRGAGLALGAALVNTLIDGLRKSGSAQLSSSSLVCLVALLDAAISCMLVGAAGGFKHVVFQDTRTFTLAVLCSSVLLLLSKALYQHALSVSQLSLTVPYLSFTPTFLVATAYLFLGEEPSRMGMLGVCVVTAGGYLLSRQSGSPASAVGGVAGKGAAGPGCTLSGGVGLKWLSSQDIAGRSGMATCGGGGAPYLAQVVVAPTVSGSLPTARSTQHLAGATDTLLMSPGGAAGGGDSGIGAALGGGGTLPWAVAEPSIARQQAGTAAGIVGDPSGRVQAHQQLAQWAGGLGTPPPHHYQQQPHHNAAARGYDASPMVVVSTAVNGKAASGGLAPRLTYGRAGHGSTSDLAGLPGGTTAMSGVGGLALASGQDRGGGGGSHLALAMPQAHHHHLHVAAAGGGGGGLFSSSMGPALLGSSSLLLGPAGSSGSGGLVEVGPKHLGGSGSSGGGAAGSGKGTDKVGAGPKGGRRGMALSQWDSGASMMIAVAFMWSVTASLDKLGVLHAPSVWVYFALQRLVIGLASGVYLAVWAPQAFRLLFTRHIRLLLLISLCETLAVVLFLEAIRYLFVSYVVAIKRCNILMSVLLGGLAWRERVVHRLPFVMLMLLGMLLIVLDPDSSTVHTSTHT